MAPLVSEMVDAGSAYPKVLHFCSWHLPQRQSHTLCHKGTGMRMSVTSVTILLVLRETAGASLGG